MENNSQSVQDTDNKYEVFSVQVPDKQAQSIKDLIRILNSIQVNQEGVTILPTQDLSYFLNVCINFTCGSYLGLFQDTNVIKNIAGKDAKKDFIAFRAKYMNFPIDAQLEDIKRLGLGNAKQQKS